MLPRRAAFGRGFCRRSRAPLTARRGAEVDRPSQASFRCGPALPDLTQSTVFGRSPARLQWRLSGVRGTIDEGRGRELPSVQERRDGQTLAGVSGARPP